MLIPGEIHVWRVPLDQIELSPPTPDESARADRFVTALLRRRFLSAHGALRGILARYTDARLDFALQEKGKPYLRHAPEIQFNLSHSNELALVAIALDTPVGVDIERIRPLPDQAAIAERFFPPSESQPADAADFFRRWTRFEAVLKAQGVGLYGAGAELEGDWMVREIEAGPLFAAAVAAAGADFKVVLHTYGELE